MHEDKYITRPTTAGFLLPVVVGRLELIIIDIEISNFLSLKSSNLSCLSASSVLKFERFIPDVWGATGTTPIGGGFI